MINRNFRKIKITLEKEIAKNISSSNNLFLVFDSDSLIVFALEFQFFNEEMILSFLKSVKLQQPNKSKLCFYGVFKNLNLKNDFLFFLNNTFKISLNTIFENYELSKDSSFELLLDSNNFLSLFPVKISKKFNLLIVEESSSFSVMLTSFFTTFKSVEVVKVASNINEALEFINSFEDSIDLVSLDLYMQSGSGKKILERHPELSSKTIVISNPPVNIDSSLGLDTLEMGVIGYFQKPTIKEMDQFKGKLRDLFADFFLKSAEEISSKMKPIRLLDFSNKDLIAIGSSTGGTEVVKEILQGLPLNFPPILIVQHMPAEFTFLFAERLTNQTGRKTIEVTEEVELKNGVAYLAAGSTHLKCRSINNKIYVFPDTSPPVNRFRPSVSVMFQSLIDNNLSNRTVAIMLTGMGHDGAQEMKKLNESGAICMAQDENSSVVFGMPKAAIELGAVDLVMSPEQIIERLSNETLLLDKIKKNQNNRAS